MSDLKRPKKRHQNRFDQLLDPQTALQPENGSQVHCSLEA